MKSVSVVGCGWLGHPLSIYLHSKNFHVTGTSRSQQTLNNLEQLGIQPQHLDLGADTRLPSSILDSQFVVLNIPPRRMVQPIETYRDIILNFVQQLTPSTKKLIFISTTSVYENRDLFYSEDMADASNPLCSLEHEISKLFQNTLILRCAGLVGEDRFIVDSLSRKQKDVQPNVKVNLVKQEDVVNAIATAIESENIYYGTYNICSDLHPTKKQCYSKWSSIFGYPIKFTSDTVLGKVVKNDAFKNDFNFKYSHPSPMEFFDY